MCVCVLVCVSVRVYVCVGARVYVRVIILFKALYSSLQKQLGVIICFLKNSPTQLHINSITHTHISALESGIYHKHN